MITFICGIPGAGKTLLLTHLAVQAMLNGVSNYRALKRETLQLNSGGFNLDLPPQRHVVYTDYSVKANKRISSYSINGYDIALPNPYFTEITYVPAYAQIFLDEAQRYYDSRMSRYLRDDVYHWYQLHRHNGYNVYMACQRLGNIDLNLRSLGECFIVIDELEVKSNEWGIIDKIIWHVHKFRSCDVAERYMLARDSHEDINLGEKAQIIADYNVLKCYDNKSCKPAFYAGLETQNYKYYMNAGYVFTAESLAEYNQTHAFTAPVGYWKNTEYDKKILNKLGVTYYGN